MPEETPELPVSPQETQIETSSFLNKIKLYKFKIMVGVLGVLVFTGGFYAGMFYEARWIATQKPLVGFPTPTPVAVATPTPDPTADWKIYTNTKYGWFLRYPSNWETEEVVDRSVIFRAPNTSYQEPTLKVKTGAEIRIMLSPYKFSGDITSLEPKIGPVPESDVTIIAVERMAVAEQLAIKIISEGIGGRSISVNVPKGTEVYQITFRSSDVPYQDTFNLILSTFKFLE
ncbi:hypothetical protein CO054_00950 [Candidatus Shapirobacteria bacterium CG_4_9_14_0_2_um_filter_39_11]|uniref:PsbP C-terminal domain-containing protein n=1 Tax=Candidatus Shapirobacteria bacterium CG_4_9_14_0_2_um_filter_39_11 TaxID=1974478 RepID=A0A2M8ET32_9BACT|nr:MAG: hypothetical protein CO054_00950 [Candidatus Shapirobacteria bacterium CG_4_9_14_0_2_um_filter_39_11]